jgi:amino-acid N-acetyltransferase
MEMITYHKAVEADIRPILDLIKPYTLKKTVLPRTYDGIKRTLDNFFVAKWQNQVVGCVALRDFGDGLEEIRTLCVHQDFLGKSIASKLIDFCHELAQNRQTTQIFALSLRPRLFLRKGFKEVAVDSLPDCVWKDDEVSSPDEKALILLDCDQYTPEL